MSLLFSSVSEILFVVGAGVSKDSPSNIPLGQELTQFILQRTCGNDVTKIFLNTWTLFSSIVKEYDENLVFNIPRLETILGCIDDLDNKLNRSSILEGIRSWVNVPPNSNHYILADFLNRGANIITTNFDLGIENAYIDRFGMCEKKELAGISVFNGRSHSSGSVFHVHGCAADDTVQLGATVKKVKSGIDDTVSSLLKNIIMQTKIIIFVGYSVSDSFDLTPFFQEIKCSSILFIQHTNSRDSQFVKLPTNINALIQGANSHNIKICNTNEFLLDAERSILNLEPTNNNHTYSFSWMEEYIASQSYSYNSNDKMINFLGLRYHLGISTDVFINAIPNLKNEIENAYHSIQSPDYRLKDYYNQTMRSFDTIKKDNIKEPTERIHKKIGYIDKSYLIVLRDECEYYIAKYSDLSVKISKNDYSRMKWLLELVKEYSNYSYKDVQYISYILASLKYASFFSAMLNTGLNPQYAEKELMLSLDISYIEGTIAAMIHLAQHYIIVDTISGNSFMHIDDIRKNLLFAKKLANISGYVYHIKRINNLISRHNLPIRI